jgi:sarcosine oxidase subunit delta
MTRLVCPFCGPRELREFLFHKTLPCGAETAYARTYERVDRPELSVEYWQHIEGCRGWLKVERNPSSGLVLKMELEGGAA